MKIPLKVGQDRHESSSRAEAKATERDVLSAQAGDWEARNSLLHAFNPLLLTLAQKRAQNDRARLHAYIEAGKQGLLRAVKRYKPKIGAEHFQVFALDCIESAMDRVDRPDGFFARLFGPR